MQALPGERTRLHLEIAVPANTAHGVPKYVVQYVQRSSLKDSVTAFLHAVDRLRLPAHKRFLRWQRTEAQVITGGLRASTSTSTWSAASSLLKTLSMRPWPIALMMLLIALVHVLAFALLAKWRLRRSVELCSVQKSAQSVVEHSLVSDKSRIRSSDHSKLSS